MDKKAGRGEGGEWEDARDAAAEMAWNGAAIWHAGTWRARGRGSGGETGEEYDKQDEVERERMKGTEEKRRR